MIIAMHLAQKEEDRVGWAKRFYDVLSKLEITVATPTLSNAGKPLHQLSSCFIDTVGTRCGRSTTPNSATARTQNTEAGSASIWGKCKDQDPRASWRFRRGDSLDPGITITRRWPLTSWESAVGHLLFIWMSGVPIFF